VGNDRVDGRRHAVYHDVDEQSRFGRRGPADHPRAAYFAGRVVECGMIVTLSDSPAENSGVEVGRARNVDSGDLDVADLAFASVGGILTPLQLDRCIYLSLGLFASILMWTSGRSVPKGFYISFGFFS